MRGVTEVEKGGWRWLVAAAFIGFLMIFGGGARPDVMSLIWLRPVAVLACVYAAVTLPPGTVGKHWFVFAMASAITSLVVLHLAPLPPAVWQSLPGRDLVADIDRATGVGSVWRPMSLAPTTTINAFFSLSVPWAVLLLCLPLDRNRLTFVLKIVAGMLVLSAFVGLAQATSGTLKLFDISNPNAGLFANRNHQAVAIACLLPIMAVLRANLKRRSAGTRVWTVLTIAVGLLLVPLLLVTGSRAGIIAFLIAIASIPFIVPLGDVRTKLASLPKWTRFAVPLAAVTLAGVAWAIWSSSRNLVALRFTELDLTQDPRFTVWPIVAREISAYLPFGSGVGTFVETFKVVEPDRLLTPQYWNHAHNDWLEVALTAGLPGVALLAAGVGAFFLASIRIFLSDRSRSIQNTQARLGLVVISILGLASVFDYPLRTPTVMGLFVVAVVLVARNQPNRRATGEISGR